MRRAAGPGRVDVAHYGGEAGLVLLERHDLDIVGAHIDAAVRMHARALGEQGAGLGEGLRLEHIHIAEELVDERRGRAVVHLLRRANLLDAGIVP